jgi:polyisoprenoid-binding protein YceI
MKFLARLVFPIVVAIVASGLARGDDAEGRHALDPKAGEVSLFVKKKGALKAFAHDHDFLANVYTGTVVWVASAPERAAIDIEIDARELVLRDGKLSADDHATVQKRALSDEVLDVAHFPKVTFVSQTVVVHAKDASGKTPVSVRGKLTLHGVAKQTVIEALLEEKQDELVLTGEHIFKQSDHGIEPYSAGFGAVAVEDAVTLTFKLVARRAK